MSRMVKGLGREFLSRIVVLDRCGERQFEGVPISSIAGDFPIYARVAVGGANRLLPSHLCRKVLTKFQRSSLERIVESDPPRFIFTNFINISVRYRSVLVASGARIFVHAHGYDCFPDLLTSDDPPRRMHEVGYGSKISELGDWATVVANSEFTRKLLEHHGVDRKSIVVKKFGVPIPARRGIDFRRGDVLRVLLFGRLVDFKGPVQALRSFLIACDQGLRATLTIAGDGPEKDEILRIIAESSHGDKIRWIGAVDPSDVQELMRDHDVFLAHSMEGPKTGQMEAFGVAYIEALSNSLPIVGTAAGGPGEIVIDRECGLVSDPLDCQSQADHLLEISNPDTLVALSNGAYSRGCQFSEQQEVDFLRALVSSRMMDPELA